MSRLVWELIEWTVKGLLYAFGWTVRGIAFLVVSPFVIYALIKQRQRRKGRTHRL